MLKNLAGHSRILAAISGALAALAGPPIDLYFLAWVALVPLLYALEKPGGKGFAEGFTAGLLFNTGTIYWFAFNSGTSVWVAGASMLVAVLILSFGWGMAARLFVMIHRRLGMSAWLIVPFSWTAWEGWLSNLGELAFPWPLLALSQSDFLPILQIMEFTGVWGVSFWVAAMNVTVFVVWRYRGLTRNIAVSTFILLIVIPFFALQHAYSYYKGDPPTLRVLIVQGNVDPLEKWVQGVKQSWTLYDSLTNTGGVDDIDLIVWPETAIPIQITTQTYISERITSLADSLDAAIISGAAAKCRKNGKIRSLNAAFFITPEGTISDIYSKQDLVPFGERVPFQEFFPSLGELNFGQAEFLPGLRQSIFETQVENTTVKFPALICFESAFPEQTRQAVLKGANLLVTISNDAWYGNCSQPYQIAAHSRFRCIETRRAMARASNAGISFLADPLGQIVAETELLTQDWKAGILPVMDHITFYVKYGDWFLAIVSLVYGVVLIWSALKPGEISGKSVTEYREG